MKSPSRIPRRLRGVHPRRVDGKFMSQSAAKGQITRLKGKTVKKRGGDVIRPPLEPPQPPKRQEWAKSFSYRGTHGHYLNVQFSVDAPGNATAQQVSDAMKSYILSNYGRDLPVEESDALDDYRIRLTGWNHGGREKIFDGDDDEMYDVLEEFDAVLQYLDEE